MRWDHIRLIFFTMLLLILRSQNLYIMPSQMSSHVIKWLRWPRPNRGPAMSINSTNKLILALCLATITCCNCDILGSYHGHCCSCCCNSYQHGCFFGLFHVRHSLVYLSYFLGRTNVIRWYAGLLEPGDHRGWSLWYLSAVGVLVHWSLVIITTGRCGFCFSIVCEV